MTPQDGTTNDTPIRTKRSLGRTLATAALALAILVLLITTVLVLDWTSALSLVGGGLLIALGASWPVLWVAALVGERLKHAENPAATARPTAPAAPVTFSVLVPARNEAEVIGGMVSQLLSQTHAQFEAIIVANNCTDDTALVARWIAAGDPRIRVVEASFEKGVKADALNLALPMATGDVVVQLDADNLVGRDFLEKIAEQFRMPSTKALQTAIRASNVDAGLLPYLQDVEFQVYSHVFNAGRTSLGRSSSIGGTGFAIRTEVIRAMGGWSRHLVEDFELHLRLARAGVPVGYLGSVAVFDEKPATWDALINQRRRWIRGHVSLALSPRSATGLPFLELMYLYSPLGIALSMTLLCLGYVSAAFPGLMPPFAYLSPGFWLASIVASAVMLTAVTSAHGRRLKLGSLLTYLFVFGFHWVVVLLAAAIPASWSATKTVHGKETLRGWRGFLGLDGVRSFAVAGVTLALAALWLAPLLGALEAPAARAAMLSPIQAPVSSQIALISVVENAEAAGQATVKGTVVDAGSGKGIKGAKLRLVMGKTSYSMTSDSHGAFSITVTKFGWYTFTVSKSSYVPASRQVRLKSGEAAHALVGLSKQHSGFIYIVPVPY